MTSHATTGRRVKSLFASWRKKAREFRSARAGNVAIIFALASMPVIGGVGAAVDFSRANAVKAKIQAALDATALKLSAEAASLNESQLDDNAKKYFLAVFSPPGVRDITVNATYTGDAGTTIVVDGSANVPTTFAGVLGLTTITVKGTSTVKWGSTKLRVALALDVTGSMSSAGKMAALKTAATNFLTTLNNAASVNGDVYASIIPFSADVNLGPANYQATWIDWTEWNANNGVCSASGGRRGRGGRWSYGSSNNGSSQSTCSGTWNPYNHNTWNGCVTDRGLSSGPDPANYDTNAFPPTVGIVGSLLAADEYDYCPEPVMGLSYNWTAMKTLVNRLSPAGNTNQGIGLATAWMSLAGGGPFTVPATPAGYTYHNIIILMTDGANTENRWYDTASQIDARQRMTCANIKAAGITLYTVQVSTDGTPSSTLLRDCASDTTKFFYLTSASQLVTTFSQIGTNLTNLRIAN